jgi:hypothetical protein
MGGALGAVGAIWGSLAAARFQHARQLELLLDVEKGRRRRQLVTLLSMVQYAEAMAQKVLAGSEPHGRLHH